MADRAERLVNLTIALLEARAPMTLADIRHKTRYYVQSDPEAGRRMFERDKDALRSMGIPLRTVSASGGTGDVGYVLDRREYELPPIQLSVEEMNALAVALSAVTDRTAATGFAKVQAASPDPSRAPRSPAVTSPLPAVADVLTEAIAQRQVVTFRYRTAAGEEGDRTIDPWTLVARRGRAYVIGRDHGKDQQRAFRLDRLTSDVRAVGDPGAFEPPRGIDVAAATPPPGAQVVSATIVVEREHRWLVEREGGLEVDRDEASVTYEVVGPEHVLVQLACSLGDRGRVEQPDELRAAVSASLEHLRDEHAPGSA
ncbi:MAG: WYL domain-containing protein [Nitriliruptorales bacterium]|nr:WYL domain-containing protein [Nitriliruptorales bacterium]